MKEELSQDPNDRVLIVSSRRKYYCGLTFTKRLRGETTISCVRSSLAFVSVKAVINYTVIVYISDSVYGTCFDIQNIDTDSTGSSWVYDYIFAWQTLAQIILAVEKSALDRGYQVIS